MVRRQKQNMVCNVVVFDIDRKHFLTPTKYPDHAIRLFLFFLLLLSVGPPLSVHFVLLFSVLARNALVVPPSFTLPSPPSS